MGECSWLYIVMPITVKLSKLRLSHDVSIEDSLFYQETLKDTHILVNERACMVQI